MSERGEIAHYQRAGRSLAGLGTLEAEVLPLVWEGGAEGVTVHDVCEKLRADRSIAYTTVQTELGHLTRKGLIACDTSRAAYRYRPAVPATEVRREVLDRIVRVIYRGHAAPAVAHLLGLASLDESRLEQLRNRAARLQDEAGGRRVGAGPLEDRGRPDRQRTPAGVAAPERARPGDDTRVSPDARSGCAGRRPCPREPAPIARRRPGRPPR